MSEVFQRRDLAQIGDSELQAVLKEYIERTTRRKVRGEIEIEVERALRVGRARENEYTAICELEDAK